MQARQKKKGPSKHVEGRARESHWLKEKRRVPWQWNTPLLRALWSRFLGACFSNRLLDSYDPGGGGTGGTAGGAASGGGVVPGSTGAAPGSGAGGGGGASRPGTVLGTVGGGGAGGNTEGALEGTGLLGVVSPGGIGPASLVVLGFGLSGTK